MHLVQEVLRRLKDFWINFQLLMLLFTALTTGNHTHHVCLKTSIL